MRASELTVLLLSGLLGTLGCSSGGGGAAQPLVAVRIAGNAGVNLPSLPVGAGGTAEGVAGDTSPSEGAGMQGAGAAGGGNGNTPVTAGAGNTPGIPAAGSSGSDPAGGGGTTGTGPTCAEYAAWTPGTLFADTQLVAHLGHIYQCDWPEDSGIVEPGVTLGWADAWTDTGLCSDGSGGAPNSGGTANAGGSGGSGGATAGTGSRAGSPSAGAGTAGRAGSGNPGAAGAAGLTGSSGAGSGGRGGSGGGGSGAAGRAGSGGASVGGAGAGGAGAAGRAGAGNAGGSGGSGGSTNFTSIISKAQFDQFFNVARAPLYTNAYSDLASGLQIYPDFAGSQYSATLRQCEVAAFLANVKHESDILRAPEQYQKDVLCDTQPWNAAYPCSGGQLYYGRGPLMISWNYNYGRASEVIFGNVNTLLQNPGQVATNGELAWETSLWFWMTQAGGASAPPHGGITTGGGMGSTIRAINGMECNGGGGTSIQQRVDYFTEICGILGLQPTACGPTSC